MRPLLAKARRALSIAGPIVGLTLAIVLFAILVPDRFLSLYNLKTVATQTVIVGLGAIGMTFVMASGGIDLSIGSVVALASVVVALLLKSGASPLVALLGGVGAGALVGAINGVAITRLRIVPFIVTLGTMLLVRGAAKGIAEERRLEAPITWLNDLLRTARGGGSFGVPMGIWITVFLAIVVAVVLGYTRFGRHLFAIGSNERTARLCGVRIERRKLQVYTAAAVFAGLAGVLQFSRLAVGDPTVAVGLELDVIAAVIIGGGSLLGGKGTVIGTVGGAAIMAVIQIGCSQHGLPNWVQQIVTGIIIVMAVALDRWRQASFERPVPAA